MHTYLCIYLFLYFKAHLQIYNRLTTAPVNHRSLQAIGATQLIISYNSELLLLTCFCNNNRSDCERSMVSGKQGSNEQDCKVWRALCLSHLFASGSGNRRHLEHSPP